MPMYHDLRKTIKESGYKNDKHKAQQIITGILNLRNGLRTEMPNLSDKGKLHMATFNIKNFGAGSAQKYTRSWAALYYLAEIISAYDLVAVQEIVGEAEHDLERLKKILGHDYDYSLSALPDTDFPYRERMAFFYNKRRIRIIRDARPMAFRDGAETVFRRLPHVITFQAGWVKFDVYSVHLTFGNGDTEPRIQECRALADYFKRKRPVRYHAVLLGDFNTPDTTCEGLQALTNVGLRIPEPLSVRTGSNAGKTRHYDHILYKPGDDGLHFTGGGVFDYFNHVFSEADASLYFDDYKRTHVWTTTSEDTFRKHFNAWRMHQMSDHLPVWVGIDIDRTDAFLHSLSKRYGK